MQPVIETAAALPAPTIVFADGARRVVLVIDRALARERLAPRILGHAARRAGDAAALETQIAAVAESLGWSVRADRGSLVHVLTVSVA